MIQRSRRVSPEAKAVFHVLSGAGKSRVKRDFFDLTDEDERKVHELWGEHVDRMLKKQR